MADYNEIEYLVEQAVHHDWTCLSGAVKHNIAFCVRDKDPQAAAIAAALLVNEAHADAEDLRITSARTLSTLLSVALRTCFEDKERDLLESTRVLVDASTLAEEAWRRIGYASLVARESVRVQKRVRDDFGSYLDELPNKYSTYAFNVLLEELRRYLFPGVELYPNAHCVAQLIYTRAEEKDYDEEPTETDAQARVYQGPQTQEERDARDFNKLVMLAQHVLNENDHDNFGFFVSDYAYELGQDFLFNNVVEFDVKDLEKAMAFALTSDKRFVYIIGAGLNAMWSDMIETFPEVPDRANAPKGYRPQYAIFKLADVLGIFDRTAEHKQKTQ